LGRILAIDYGQKRAGLAVTDELRIIATGLDTVHIKDIFKYLVNYVKREKVDCFVVGKPVQLDKNSENNSPKFLLTDMTNGLLQNLHTTQCLKQG